MEYLFTLIVLAGSIFGLYFLIKKQINKNSQDNSKELESKLAAFIDAFKLTSAENLNKQLQDSKQDQKNMEVRFSETINKLTKELEKIKGTNEQVLTFANQMKTLEKILGNQKQRGILGEIQLENLLANVLPPELFQMQYSFNNGEDSFVGLALIPCHSFLIVACLIHSGAKFLIFKNSCLFERDGLVPLSIVAPIIIWLRLSCIKFID